jgi:alpha-1,2-mannosyltransferase
MTALASDRPTVRTHPNWRRGSWLVLGISVAGYLALRLWWDPPAYVDISVYRAEAQALSDGEYLYGPLQGVHGLGTYPPFAAVVFLPLLLVSSGAADTLSLLLNVGLVVAAAYLSVRRLTASRADLHLAVPLLAAVALWCEPVMLNNSLGQVNLLILCLVLWDFSLTEDSRWRGVGIGLAAAIKVTPGIFIVYLLVTKRFRAAAGAIATLGATFAVSAVLAPRSTWDYWTHHLFEPSRVGRLENSTNQTVRGWLVRASHTVDTAAVSAVMSALILVLGLAAAAYCYRRRGDGSALLVVAVAGLVASPISWSHHWVWCLPLLAYAWFEARAWVLPTLLVFWSYAVWFVPHGDHVELRLNPLQVAMSGWYVVFGACFIAWATLGAQRHQNPDPPLRGPGFSRASGRADRI